ncbi:MAG: ATP-binding cassette domain-containing protein [Gracilibacteraceae bacterium]|jgi:ABC-type multidrug transport system ATPase subunit|nr:ATP-binding cassette domain-containing protein [Gracilibacteraceae bacterium]
MENILLTVSRLQKKRGAPLFAPVSFTLGRGGGLGIYGRNGCGKTTLLDIVAGLTPPDAGEFTCSGRVGYVMQRDGFQDALSCRDNLRVEAALCALSGRTARARIQACAEQCDIVAFWRKRLSRCSVGMRARLAIAAALLPDPDILLLDEAFSGLDQESAAAVQQLLREKKQAGTALLLVSHNREDFVGLCEHVLELPEAEWRPV